MKTLAAASAALMLAAAASACSAPMKPEPVYPVIAHAPPPPPVYAVAPITPSDFALPHDGGLEGPPSYGAPYAAEPRRASDCAIRVSRTRIGVDITPVAMPGRAMNGEYDLVITKSGASGSSDVTQGGPFRARAGETVALGSTELSLGRRDRYRAVLTLTDGRRQICRTEVRS